MGRAGKVLADATYNIINGEEGMKTLEETRQMDSLKEMEFLHLKTWNML